MLSHPSTRHGNGGILFVLVSSIRLLGLGDRWSAILVSPEIRPSQTASIKKSVNLFSFKRLGQSMSLAIQSMVILTH